jgi:hypothetical protein
MPISRIAVYPLPDFEPGFERPDHPRLPAGYSFWSAPDFPPVPRFCKITIKETLNAHIEPRRIVHSSVLLFKIPESRDTWNF